MGKKTRATSGARTLEAIAGLERAGDRKLVADAQKALREKRQPTRAQLRAWKRHVDKIDADDRAALLAGVTHKLLREMAGNRSSKVVYDLQDRYGIPTRGAVVSMHDFVRGVFDWFAVNARKINRLKDEDSEDVGGENSPALERLRAAKALREEFAYERDRDLWIRRTEFHDGLSLFSGIIRRAGERLQRKFGRDAHTIIDEALVDAGDVLRRRFEGGDEAEGNGQ